MPFDSNYIFLIGFLAQGLFFSRFAVQIFLSERAKASLSPTLFWQMSMLASILMVVYGLLRKDFSIIEGQMISYFIYVRNLQLKEVWKSIPRLLRWQIILTPVAAILIGLTNSDKFIAPLFTNPSIPPLWLIVGIIGQTIFASRFIYQWLYSEYKKASVFPLGFWVISIVGSATIVVYAVSVRDWVLIVGHGFGLAVYSRNLYLCMAEDKNAERK